MQTEPILLDAVDGIEFDPQKPVATNLHALDFLPQGLYRLAETVRREENELVQFHKKQGKRPPTFAGLGIKGIDESLVICSFHWFSVSLANYLRLIALVDYYQKNGITQSDVVGKTMKKSIKKHCDAYQEKVCPDIVKWRNKVGAHLAITSPYDIDNQATLEMSAMCNIAYRHNRLYTGELIWNSNGHTAELPRWSVTEVFESLAPRFWPKTKLTWQVF